MYKTALVGRLKPLHLAFSSVPQPARQFKEGYDKSVADLSELVTGKCGFPVAYQINQLLRSILVARPCITKSLTETEFP